MSEVPSGSWDSPQVENLAHQVGREQHTSGEPAGNDGDAAETDPADVHSWYTTGLELLTKGSPAAAAQVLQRAAKAEPGSLSVREALARAQFDTGRYETAAANFRAIVEASPSDDYAHFGLGLALARGGDHEAAAEYLALAAAMRPDRKPYTDALHQVRATLKSRRPPSDQEITTSASRRRHPENFRERDHHPGEDGLGHILHGAKRAFATEWCARLYKFGPMWRWTVIMDRVRARLGWVHV
jgi:predicted Zn-dependent protease